MTSQDTQSFTAVHAPHPHRWTRALGWLLVVAGLLVLADVGITLVWQEPVSALYARLRQDSLGKDLGKLERAQPSSDMRRALRRVGDERRRIEYLAAALRRHADSGSAVGRIGIPAIGADFVVVKGTGSSELQGGPGIYPQTGFPSVAGTTAIAGHRTTYLAPFRHIDALRPGNRILLSMPYGRFTYRVTGTRVVAPSDVRVIAAVGYPQLVLSACTPLFSAAQRIVVFARLQSIVPLGAARRGGGDGAAELRFGLRTGGRGVRGGHRAGGRIVRGGHRTGGRGVRGDHPSGGRIVRGDHPSGGRGVRGRHPSGGLAQVLESLQSLPVSLVA